MYTIQMVSITHFSVKAVVLKMTPSVGMEDGTYIPRTGKEIRSL